MLKSDATLVEHWNLILKFFPITIPIIFDDGFNGVTLVKATAVEFEAINSYIVKNISDFGSQTNIAHESLVSWGHIFHSSHYVS